MLYAQPFEYYQPLMLSDYKERNLSKSFDTSPLCAISETTGSVSVYPQICLCNVSVIITTISVMIKLQC